MSFILNFKKTLWLLFLLLMSALACQPIALAQALNDKGLSDEDINSIYSDTVWYQSLICSASPTSELSNNPASPVKIDISAIAKKHDLQSAMVKQIGGDVAGSHNPSAYPNAVASILKLIVADVFLSNNPNLGQITKVKSSQLYNNSPAGTAFSPKAGQSFTLREMLIQTLQYSSDTDANVLIDAAGGLRAATTRASELGYKKTTISAYYHDPPAGRNLTTAADLTKALEKIYVSTTDNYHVAQMALRNETYTFGLDSEMNKWGGTSKVTGNSAVFQVAGSRYIITVYKNAPWVDPPPSASVSHIRDTNEEILDLLKKASGAADEDTQCNSGLDAVGDVTGNAALGKELASRLYSWEGRQWACLYHLWKNESGWSETADNPTSDAYGIPQALPGDKMATEGKDWRTSPETQIRWGLKYIKGRYGTPCHAWAFWQSQDPHWY